MTLKLERRKRNYFFSSFDISKSRLLVGLVLLLAILLRLYQISTESLWMDEMLSVHDALGIIGDSGSVTKTVRPFYYLILRIWMVFGQGDAWLRGLSVVLGLGTIYLTYELGRKLLSERIGLLAAFVMSIAPLFINHAQEVRMYTLISFLSVLGSLCLCNLMERVAYGWMGLWIASRIALLLTNANNVLILLPDFLIILFVYRNQRRQLFKFAAGFLVICSSFLPTVYQLTFGGTTGSFMTQVADYAKPGLLQIGGMITQFSAYYPLSYLLAKTKIGWSEGDLSDASLLQMLFSSSSLIILFFAAITLILSGLMAVSLLAFFKRKASNTDKSSGQFSWILAWALLPALLMLAVSYVKQPIWFPRYLLFIAPYFLLILATGFVELWNWRKPVAIAIAAIYLAGNFIGLNDYYTTLYRNDWQGLAEVIAANEQPGDKIFYYSIGQLYNQSLPRYYEGENPIQLITLNNADSKSLTNEPEEIQTALTEEPVDSRLWLVCWVFCEDEAGIEEVFETALGPNYSTPIAEEFTSVEETVRLKVYLATTPGASD